MSTNQIKDTAIDKFLGVQLPLCNSQYGYFNPSIFTIDQVKSDIKNLIMTRKGSRLMQPELGTNIYNILFEQIDIYEIEEYLISDITSSINNWLPYIFIDDIKISVGENLVNISLSFKLNELDEEINKFNLTINYGYGV